MSENYRFVETRIEYPIEQEQYQMSPQFEENVCLNDMQEQEIEQMQFQEEENVTNETIKEQRLEKEVSTLKFQEAHAFIRERIKEAIYKKESQTVDLVVLSEKNKIRADQVAVLENLRDTVNLETEELNIKVEVGREEMQSLQESFLSNIEIADKLEECIKTTIEGSEQIKRRHQQIVEKLAKQTEQIGTLQKLKARVSELKSEISKKRSRRNTNDDKIDAARKEKEVLKIELLDKKKSLANLVKESEEKKLKRIWLNSLKEEKERLEKILNNQIQKVLELKETKKKNEKQIEEYSKQLSLDIDERKNRYGVLQQNLVAMKLEIQERTEKLNELKDVLIAKEQTKAKLEEENTKVCAQLNECERNYEESSNKWKENAQTTQAKVIEIDTKLAAVIKQNDELTRELQSLKQQHITVLEEKNEKLMLHFEMEKEMREDEVILGKIKHIEEKNVMKQKIVDELAQKIENLSEDARLQEVEKKKAYLTSSTDYLREKYDSVLKEVEEIKKEVEQEERDEEVEAALVQEKRKTYDKLLRKLQDLSSPVDADDSQRPISGILKSPSSHKKFPISPKKVKFENMSSCESNGNGEAVCKEETTVVGKTIDEILNMRTFKKPATSIKKRKLDLD